MSSTKVFQLSKIYRFACKFVERTLPIFCVILFAFSFVFSSGYALGNDPAAIVGEVGTVLFFVLSAILYLYKFNLGLVRESIKRKRLPILSLVPYFLIVFIAVSLIWNISANQFLTVAHYALLLGGALFFCSSVPFSQFSKFYCKSLDYLSVFSIVIYVLSIVLGQGIFTSTFVSSKGVSYLSFLGVYFSISHLPFRNCGPFWEPGIFATFILVGLYFNLFLSEKRSLGRTLIYGTCLLTTMSTAGILLGLLLLFIYVLKEKKYVLAILGSSTLIALLLLLFLLNRTGIYIPVLSDIFGKLSTQSVSFMTRIYSVYYDLLIFVRSPILGIGPNKTDEIYLELIQGNQFVDSQTSSLGWILAAFGIPGLLCIAVFLCALLFLISRRIGKPAAIATVLWVLLITNKENQYAFSLFWVLLYYPIVELGKKESFAIGGSRTLFDFYKSLKPNSKKSAENILGSTFFKCLAMVVGLFTLPIYISYFSDDAVTGVWSTLLSILSMVLTFDLGIGNGMKNKVIVALANGDQRMAKKYVSNSYFYTAIISAVIFVCGLSIIWLVDLNALLNIDSTYASNFALKCSFSLALLSVCIEFVLKNASSLLQALQKQTSSSFLTFAPTLLLLIFASIVKISNPEYSLIVLSGFYVLAVNLPFFVANLVLFNSSCKEIRPSLRLIDRKAAREVMNLGLAFFGIQLALLAINSTNQLLISNNLTSSVVVEYQKYYKVYSALAALASAISMPIWSMVVKAKAEGDYKWIRKINRLCLAASFGFLLFGVLASFALQTFFDIWLGDETIKVSFIKAACFTLWLFALCASYFASSVGNGLRVLIPQFVPLFTGALLKVLLSILLKNNIASSNLTWGWYLIMDSAILLLTSLITFAANLREINKVSKLGLTQ